MSKPASIEGDPELRRAIELRDIASRPLTPHVRTLRKVATLCGLLTMAISLTAIIGWVTGLTWLTTWQVQTANLRFLPAVCLLVVGMMIVTLAYGPFEGDRPRTLSESWILIAGATLIFLIAGSALIQDLSGSNWGIDNPFKLDNSEPSQMNTPGRMAPATAAALLLQASSTVAQLSGKFRVTQGLAIMSTLIGAVSLVGYLTVANDINDLAAFNRMAFQTATAIVIAGIGTLLITPNNGYMRLVAGNTLGGILVRRYIPFAVIVPIVVVSIVSWCVRREYFSAPLGFALTGAVLSLVGVAGVWLLGQTLRNVDLRRAGAEDLLERVRTAENAREKALADLRDANAELEHFATIAAHDLRSPLTAIRANGEFLLEDPDVAALPDAVGTVNRIITATHRGNSLIDDLLAYSFVGVSEFSVKPFDVTDLARTIADEQIGASPRGGVVQVDEMPEVAGDKNQINQVLSNLIGNALRYCPADREPRIHVYGEPDNRGLYRITVADNGLGVPPQERDTVFQIFKRGTRTSTISGSGVGLAICQRVIKRHGGQIWVEENEPTGSRFSFTIPSSV